MGTLKDDIIERLRLEVEIAGPLVPRLSTQNDAPKRANLPNTEEAMVAGRSAKQVTNVKERSSTKTDGKIQKKKRTVPKAGDKAEVSIVAKGRKRAVEDAPGVNGAITDPYERIANLIPETSPLRDFKLLKEVEDYVANTILIELDKVRLNPVFGVGNPNADLMVIGEAPGANEDEQGEPFVGRAGKLLTDILAAIKFSRDDVYIANILKSRPPNNRNPTSDEIAAHVPILHKQITLIRPKIMLCVGKVAANSLLGNTSSLTSMRESIQDYHGIPVVVTYHPAALLRNPNWKRPAWEDVQRLRKRFDELVTEPGA